MRTTLDLPDDTFRRLKTQAAISDLKLKTLVTQYIECGLAAGTEASTTETTRARPPIPVARKANGSVTPALNNAQLHQWPDEQDRV